MYDRTSEGNEAITPHQPKAKLHLAEASAKVRMAEKVSLYNSKNIQ